MFDSAYHPAKGTLGAALVEAGVNLKADGLMQLSVTVGITASTTHSRAGATKLTTVINKISTCANAGDAVLLPAMLPGQYVDIYNDGVAAAGVYPNAGTDAIDGGTAGAAVTLTNAKRCRYTCLAAGVIESAQLGVVSA